MARQPDERAELRIQAILDATLRLLGTNGLASVTHRRVAAEAGVPLGSTTYYFKSKSDLLLAALQLAEVQDTERLEAVRDELASCRTPDELADAIVRLLIEERMYPDPTPIIAQFELLVAAVRVKELRAMGNRWDATLGETVAAGFEAVGGTTPALDARTVMANVYGHQARVLRSVDAREAIDEARVDMRRLVRGLVAAPADSAVS